MPGGGVEVGAPVVLRLAADRIAVTVGEGGRHFRPVEVVRHLGRGFFGVIDDRTVQVDQGDAQPLEEVGVRIEKVVGSACIAQSLFQLGVDDLQLRIEQLRAQLLLPVVLEADEADDEQPREAQQPEERLRLIGVFTFQIHSRSPGGSPDASRRARFSCAGA